MTVPKLDAVAIGSPITRLGVSFFPVYLAANDLPPIATGEGSGLVVDELDDASVQTLRVRNPGDKPVLVVEGEHFLGGKQNRALNATVLVPARAELEIPVSCLEQGRWGRPHAYRRDDTFAAAPVRAAQHAGVARSMARRGFARGRPVGGLARSRPDAGPRRGELGYRGGGRRAPGGVPPRALSRRLRSRSSPRADRFPASAASSSPTAAGCRRWICSAPPTCSPLTGPR